MNTSEVANLLGVSSSTIQRWVKQLELPMERNERGHYYFNPDDIELLKNIQDQIHNGVLLQEITPVKEKKTRKGSVKAVENHAEVERLYMIVTELEAKVNSKADSVTSYQLLQHRREIEELQSQINELTTQVNQLQSKLNELLPPAANNHSLAFDQEKVKRKKKSFVSSLFGF